MGNSRPLKSDVFHRTHTDGPVVSNGTYNTIIGMVLCWGFFINLLIVRYINTTSLLQVSPVIFMIGYFASCFLGVYLYNSSKDPSISFLGYNFVVVPIGVVLNIGLSRYDPNLVIEAIRVTALVTVTMMVLGTLFPDFFQRIHMALLMALLAVIVIELIQVLVLRMERTWADWVVVTVFCGYIGYDWGRANRIPKTLDNAIDSAAAIYMDIINIFVRILGILERRRK